jgi:hypothetical protein
MQVHRNLRLQVLATCAPRNASLLWPAITNKSWNDNHLLRSPWKTGVCEFGRLDLWYHLLQSWRYTFHITALVQSSSQSSLNCCCQTFLHIPHNVLLYIVDQYFGWWITFSHSFLRTREINTRDHVVSCFVLPGSRFVSQATSPLSFSNASIFNGYATCYDDQFTVSTTIISLSYPARGPCLDLDFPLLTVRSSAYYFRRHAHWEAVLRLVMSKLQNMHHKTTAQQPRVLITRESKMLSRTSDRPNKRSLPTRTTSQKSYCLERTLIQFLLFRVFLVGDLERITWDPV